MEKSKIKAKKVECILGIFFLIPPILGVIAFVINLLGGDGDFAEMDNLSSSWTQVSRGGMSAAPIYLGLMALAGIWLVKGSTQYLFTNKDE